MLEKSASLEATGGWMIDGVCVFLVYLRTRVCLFLRIYVCVCVCLCVCAYMHLSAYVCRSCV